MATRIMEFVIALVKLIYPPGSLVHGMWFDLFCQVRYRPLFFFLFLWKIFESYCHLPCFHFKSPLSNSVHTVHYCACCLPTGTPIISLVLLSGKHGNAGSCQIDPTEGAVWPFSLFNRGRLFAWSVGWHTEYSPRLTALVNNNCSHTWYHLISKTAWAARADDHNC